MYVAAAGAYNLLVRKQASKKFSAQSLREMASTTCTAIKEMGFWGNGPTAIPEALQLELEHLAA